MGVRCPYEFLPAFRNFRLEERIGKEALRNRPRMRATHEGFIDCRRTRRLGIGQVGLQLFGGVDGERDAGIEPAIRALDVIGARRQPERIASNDRAGAVEREAVVTQSSGQIDDAVGESGGIEETGRRILATAVAPPLGCAALLMTS